MRCTPGSNALPASTCQVGDPFLLELEVEASEVALLPQKELVLDRIRNCLLRSDPALVNLSFAEHEMRVQDVCYVPLDGLKCNSVLRTLDLSDSVPSHASFKMMKSASSTLCQTSSSTRR
jgi:hypothetical protein